MFSFQIVFLFLCFFFLVVCYLELNVNKFPTSLIRGGRGRDKLTPMRRFACLRCIINNNLINLTKGNYFEFLDTFLDILPLE